MLQDIKGAILKEARKEGESALQKAEAELETEFAKIRSEGEAKVKSSEEEARKLVESERRERLSWAKLEAKRVLAEAREDAVNTAIEGLIDEIKAYSRTRDYAAKLRKSVSSVISEFQGKVVVHVRKADKNLISLPDASVSGDADILGGAIVESKDGKLRMDLSMEELLEANRDAVRKDIYAALFSEKKKR
ncbi:MAG: V-type ATP synthase subunit E family protein [Candidatus ainarchaeum sp.]|nr:V-type ATP synthase subunit E family protein [Candidatus ainarchaeum sp.]